MNIDFIATRDSQYVRRLARDFARTRFWFAVFYLVGAVLVTVLCFLSRDGRAVLAALVNLVLVGLAWASVLAPGRRPWADPPSYFLRTYRYVITEDAVTTSSAEVSGWFVWDTVRRVEERPYAFLLFDVSGGYRDVPRGALSSDQDDELRRFLIGRGLLRTAGHVHPPRPASAEDQSGR
jgi:hypothetical protein